jgi:hypothetical protein
MKKIILSFLTFLILTGNTSFAQTKSQTSISITKDQLSKAGSFIPASMIGEPVGSVKLYEPRWVDATESTPAYGVVEGSIMPVDPNGWPINFRVILPANWSQRSMQAGGGGMNGTITVREGRNPLVSKGFALYGSDSGHQAGGMMGFGGGQNKPLASGPTPGDEWALNDEAIKNMGYMQMKKTHDAAMVIMERIYGKRPVYNYYVGTSHGGRESLTVAQRYPKDYSGIIANVPIVNFSSLMLAPEFIRIQERPLKNWVTPAKVNAVRTEFLRQCDKLDGLSDGIINNYMAARAIFNVNDGVGPKDPWAALRAPNNTDPDPSDKSESAKLTNEQIKTMELTYSSYSFATPLANGVKSFGMWLPTVEPDGFDMITGRRFKGQEGAQDNAPTHGSLGSLGVTGFLMQDLKSNPLDYVEGGKWNQRREQLSKWLDSTNPDLSAFFKNGGKMIVTIGTMDNIASPGAQLDYYQSLIDKMGRSTIDQFARLYVVPQAGHGLSGRGYKINGEGQPVDVKNVPAPNGDDNMAMLVDWVENNQAPSKTLVVDPKGRISQKQEGAGYLMCSYPNYPKYVSGSTEQASSYVSADK